VAEISLRDARRIFLRSVELGGDRRGRAGLDDVLGLIRRLGYVQVDSINVVERAHHLILWSRLAGYKKSQLAFLLEKKRALFEHWTHDASILPIEWFPHYHGRFERDRARIRKQPWWRERMTGGKRMDLDAFFANVLSRFEREGPLGTGHFAEDITRPKGSGGFWGWTPSKAALEYLWRTGELAVAHRSNFQKVYDLAHRVLAHVDRDARPTAEAQRDWAFGGALARIGLGTARELSAFFHDLDRHEAARWAAQAAASGRAIEGRVLTDEGRRPVFLSPDWEERLSAVGGGSDIRLLSPFDPLLRDRARVKLLFGVDFRFEGFVPKADRTHGYYVMAALEDDELVARIDPKLDRARGTLVIQNVWWTPRFEGSPERTRALDKAVNELAAWLGAGQVDWLARLQRQRPRAI
jgi:uncharacterized protein YcaQ